MLVTTKPVYSVDNRLNFLWLCVSLVMCEMDIEIEARALKTFDFDCWQTSLDLSSDI